MPTTREKATAELYRLREWELANLGGVTTLNGVPMDGAVWNWDAGKRVFVRAFRDGGVRRLEGEGEVMEWEAREREWNPQFRGLRRCAGEEVAVGMGGKGVDVGGKVGEERGDAKVGGLAKRRAEEGTAVGGETDSNFEVTEEEQSGEAEGKAEGKQTLKKKKSFWGLGYFS